MKGVLHRACACAEEHELQAPRGTISVLIFRDTWEIHQDEDPAPIDVKWLDSLLDEHGVTCLPPPFWEGGIRIWIMAR